MIEEVKFECQIRDSRGFTEQFPSLANSRIYQECELSYIELDDSTLRVNVLVFNGSKLGRRYAVCKISFRSTLKNSIKLKILEKIITHKELRCKQLTHLCTCTLTCVTPI